MNARTCGTPSAYELRTSPEFADWSDETPEPEEIEAELEQRCGMETNP